eukprot:g3742.t1
MSSLSAKRYMFDCKAADFVNEAGITETQAELLEAKLETMKKTWNEVEKVTRSKIAKDKLKKCFILKTSSNPQSGSPQRKARDGVRCRKNLSFDGYDKERLRAASDGKTNSTTPKGYNFSDIRSFLDMNDFNIDGKDNGQLRKMLKDMLPNNDGNTKSTEKENRKTQGKSTSKTTSGSPQRKANDGVRCRKNLSFDGYDKERLRAASDGKTNSTTPKGYNFSDIRSFLDMNDFNIDGKDNGQLRKMLKDMLPNNDGNTKSTEKENRKTQGKSTSKTTSGSPQRKANDGVRCRKNLSFDGYDKERLRAASDGKTNSTTPKGYNFSDIRSFLDMNDFNIDGKDNGQLRKMLKDMLPNNDGNTKSTGKESRKTKEKSTSKTTTFLSINCDGQDGRNVKKVSSRTKMYAFIALCLAEQHVVLAQEYDKNVGGYFSQEIKAENGSGIQTEEIVEKEHLHWDRHEKYAFDTKKEAHSNYFLIAYDKSHFKSAQRIVYVRPQGWRNSNPKENPKEKKEKRKKFVSKLLSVGLEVYKLRAQGLTLTRQDKQILTVVNFHGYHKQQCINNWTKARKEELDTITDFERSKKTYETASSSGSFLAWWASSLMSGKKKKNSCTQVPMTRRAFLALMIAYTATHHKRITIIGGDWNMTSKNLDVIGKVGKNKITYRNRLEQQCKFAKISLERNPVMKKLIKTVKFHVCEAQTIRKFKSDEKSHDLFVLMWCDEYTDKVDYKTLQYLAFEKAFKKAFKEGKDETESIIEHYENTANKGKTKQKRPSKEFHHEDSNARLDHDPIVLELEVSV